VERHYALAAGYGTALLGWFLLSRAVPLLWPKRDAPHFANPGRELAFAVLGLTGTLILGFLYSRGRLLPGSVGGTELIDVVSQLIVFAPTLLVVALRRHPLATLWLPTDRIFIRIATGILLALGALTAYVLVVDDRPVWIEVMQSVYHHRNFPILLQVLLEDVTAAFLAVRIAGVLGRLAAPILAAVILSASHLTATLAAGLVPSVLETALIDVFLSAAVVAVVQRSADVWWFWGVHFAMDMTQYVTQGLRT
jgi:hypothetical protein